MTAEQSEELEVVVLSFEDGQEESPIVGLKRVFGLDDAAAARIVGQLPVTVQRGVPRVRAEYFRRALKLIGACVEVRSASGEVIEAPPQTPPPGVAEPTAPRDEQDSSGSFDAVGLTDPAPPMPEAPAPAMGAGTIVQGLTPGAAPEPKPQPQPAGATLREAVPAPDKTPAPKMEAQAENPPTKPAMAPPADALADGWGGLKFNGRGDSERPGAAVPASLRPAAPAIAPQPAPGRRDPSPDGQTGITLDTDGGQEGPVQVLGGWEQPDTAVMAEPAAGQARARGKPPNDLMAALTDEGAGAAMGALLGAVPQEGSAAGGTARAGRKARPGKRPAGTGFSTGLAPAQPNRGGRVFDTRSFWESLGDGLVLPFVGPGIYWLVAISVWAVFAGLVTLAATFAPVPLLDAIVAFVATTTLLAFACDYYNACFWTVSTGEERIDRSPTFNTDRVLNRYLKDGMNLSLFALVTQLPLVFWLVKQGVDGGVLAVALHPVSWLLALFPGFYWCMAVCTTALRNQFSGIWQVHMGLRALVRCPLEYLAVCLIGFVLFALPTAGLLLLGTTMQWPTSMLTATLGFPLAISHGMMGALMGHLVRARPEAFED